MKKLKKVFTLFLVVVLLTIFLSVAISTISVDLSAFDPDQRTEEGAKDPHSHVGEKTVCYNQEDWACDT